MIDVVENFLPQSVFKDLQHYCATHEFKIIDTGDKAFSILGTPSWIYPYLLRSDATLNLTFIRSAHKDFDTDHRIHCDGIMLGKPTSLASVLYINDSEGVTENGTAFYEHHKHGERLNEQYGSQELDRLLFEDAEKPDLWKLNKVIEALPNKMLVYDARLFHSKVPKVVEHGTRIVLVSFYSPLQP